VSQPRDAYERFALDVWEYLKDSARLFIPYTVPFVTLWVMALSAEGWLKVITLPVAAWLTVCLIVCLRGWLGR
jgi:hypothetical protein